MRRYLWIAVVIGVFLSVGACKSAPRKPSGVGPASPTNSVPMEPQVSSPSEPVTDSPTCPPASVRLTRSDCERLEGVVRQVWKLVQERDEPGLQEVLGQDELEIGVEGYGQGLPSVFSWAAERGKNAEIQSIEVSDRKSYSIRDAVSIHTTSEVFLIMVRISDGKVVRILIGSERFLYY